MPKKVIVPLPSGYVAPGFEEVLNIFRNMFEKGLDKGSCFAAFYKGKPVVNLWGGLADEQVKRPWKEDTLGFLHSTTKFVAAVTVAHMVERGMLSYKQKISSLWPEFAQNGKKDITLETLMSLRAGLAALSDDWHFSWLRDDPQRMADALARQKPLWTPGEAHGYHVMTIGLYLNEIVKRADKKQRTLSQYFKDEIAEPFGIDISIGLPKPHQHRLCRLEPMRLTAEDYAERLADFKGDLDLYNLHINQPKDWISTRMLNDPDYIELPSPSAHGTGTALAMAKLTGILANGGEHDGKRLLSPESIQHLQEPLSHGPDKALGTCDVYGRGSILTPIVEGDKHWYMFGHSGYGDQNSAADSHYDVGWAYLTNYLDPNATFNKKHRWWSLVETLFACVHHLEGVKVDRKMLKSQEELNKVLKEKSLLTSKL